MTGSGSGAGAAQRLGDELRWQPGRKLSPNEYATTRAAGFKWHKGKRAWVARWTPERDAFLLHFVSQITRPVPAPFQLIHPKVAA